ncbi:hypothetical protein LIER_25413 [Lithospermum erythrorhizon]|uniref:Reverse transcriptase domain-containing protein n=1 Tax=Lithospermum erythrorhizon TaxID=34254 RepID=A0AAV3R8Z4_LITER
MVNNIFKEQIGRNMEIYIDDMLVKNKVTEDHLNNLRESLDRLRDCRLRINPEKCSFGVTLGKFLGFMISERGIEPNPNLPLRHGTSIHIQGSAKASGSVGDVKQIHIKGKGPEPPLLQENQNRTVEPPAPSSSSSSSSSSSGKSSKSSVTYSSPRAVTYFLK